MTVPMIRAKVFNIVATPLWVISVTEAHQSPKLLAEVRLLYDLPPERDNQKGILWG
jgi:hypothetical protein